jgi:7-cyano-7-deazaguanine synthase
VGKSALKLLLFSGGVESTCLAYQMRPDLLVTINYGQKPADGEISAAKHIAAELNLKHECIEAPMRELGRGEMAGVSRQEGKFFPEWWPYRNQLLVTLAAMRFERDDLKEVIIGTIKSDSVHSDGTHEFVANLNALMMCQEPKIYLRAPAINLTTTELVVRSEIPIDLLRWTFSCHRSSIACGVCRGCNKTIKLFQEFPIDSASGA